MKLLILGFLMVFSVNSYGKVQCSKGYSTVERAEVAVAAYFNMENLDWCKDLDKGSRGAYAQYKMVKECVVEGEKHKINIMEVFGGPCAFNGVVASIGMYTYQYAADIDPNEEEPVILLSEALQN